MLSKLSYITVQLLEPIIYIESNSSTCSVVRGTININLPKTTTIKSILVRFDGKIETKSSSFDVMETAGSFIRKKPLAHQSLAIYPQPDQPSSRVLILNTGLTQFGFEMQIPSGLPETIDCRDIKVNYNVTAVMEYYTTSSLLRSSRTTKDSFKQAVRVTRLPYENILLGDNMLGSIDSQAHKCRWLKYQIFIDKKAVSLGSDLPITFRFQPIYDGVSVDRLSIQLLERRDIFRNTTRTNHSVHNLFPCANNKVVAPSKPLTEEWIGTIDYTVPSDKSLVHSTQEYLDFNVSHTLLISIGMSVPGAGGRLAGGRVSKMVTFSANIDVLDKTVGELESLKLPSYDSPPPFESTSNNETEERTYSQYDCKFADPPTYSEVCC